MTPRRILVLVAVVVALGVVATGLAVVTAAALPVALAAGLGVLALVAGSGTRRLRRPGRRVPATPGGAPADPPDPSRLHWTARWTREPPVTAVPGTRERLTVVLAEWGVTGEAAEPTLLVLTELLSNAIEHAPGPVACSVELVPAEQGPVGSVRVEVRDHTAEPPQRRPVDPSQRRGRGLHLVEALSSRWSWTGDPPGKVVWAEVPTAWPA